MMLLWGVTLAACGLSIVGLPRCLATLVVEPTRLPDERERQLALMQRAALEGAHVVAWSLPITPGDGVAKSYVFPAQSCRLARTARSSLHAIEMSPMVVSEPGAPVVVALHGFSDSLMGLEPMALSLVKKGYRVLLLDMLGHGLSPSGQCTYGRLEIAAIHEALCHYAHSVSDAGSRQMVLVGSSFGGVMAMKLALHQQVAPEPLSVRAVVAAGPYHHLPTAIHRYAQVMYGISWPPLLRAISSTAARLSGLTPAEEIPIPSDSSNSLPPLVLMRGQHDVLLRRDEAASLVKAWPGEAHQMEFAELEHFGLLRRQPAIDAVQALLEQWAKAAKN